jgi:hypothetical protein
MCRVEGQQTKHREDFEFLPKLVPKPEKYNPDP